MPDIDRAIRLVRRGDFIRAASDPKLMKELAAVTPGADPPLESRVADLPSGFG